MYEESKNKTVETERENKKSFSITNSKEKHIMSNLRQQMRSNR